MTSLIEKNYIVSWYFLSYLFYQMVIFTRINQLDDNGLLEIILEVEDTFLVLLITVIYIAEIEINCLIVHFKPTLFNTN